MPKECFYTFEVIQEILGQVDAEHLNEYYKEPVMCLLKIKDSVDKEKSK